MRYPRYVFKTDNLALLCLTDEEIELAISLYQNQYPIDEIKERLNLRVENEKFYDSIPYERWMGCLCGAVIYFKLSPINEKRKADFYCPTCGIDSTCFTRE